MERDDAIITTALWAIDQGLHCGEHTVKSLLGWIEMMRALEVSESELRTALLHLQRENDRHLVELMWTRPVP